MSEEKVARINELLKGEDNPKHKIKVLIGIPQKSDYCSPHFQVSLDSLKVVPRTGVFRAVGGVLPAARNKIVKAAQEMDAEYILFLDDDTLLESDLLLKLLSHNLDIVVGNCLFRKPPFAPLLFQRIHDDASYYQYFLEDSKRSGLIKIEGAGMGAVLIKTSIFYKLEQPYFTFERSKLNPDDYAEDLPFWKRIKDLGIEVYADLTAKLGHIASVAVWPGVHDNKWVTILAQAEPFLAMPAAQGENRIIIPELTVK